MGKIKGWKKVQDITNLNNIKGQYVITFETISKSPYVHSSNNTLLFNSKITIWKPYSIEKKKDIVQVIITKKIKEDYKEKRIEVKTKKEALDYAYAYMRSNPNG